MMTENEAIKNLQSSLKRITQVKEWCKISDLPNVGADMLRARKEIEDE